MSRYLEKRIKNEMSIKILEPLIQFRFVIVKLLSFDLVRLKSLLHAFHVYSGARTFSQPWKLNDLDPPVDLRERCPAFNTINFLPLRMAEVAGELSSPAAIKVANHGNPTP
jgi:hypothetical protein